MASTSKSRILRLAAACTGSQVSVTAYRLASVPIFLFFLSPGTYGAWLALSSLPSWLSMADLGMGNAAGNEVCLRSAQEDYAGARRAFTAAWVCLMITTVFIALVSALVLVLVPADWWMHYLQVSAKEAIWCCALLGISVIVSFQAGLFSAHFRAVHQAHQTQIFSASAPWLELGLTTVSLIIHLGFVGMAAAILIARLVYVTVMGLVAHRIAPWLRLDFAPGWKSDVIPMLRRGTAFSLYPLGNALLFQGNLLVVTATLGTSATAVFGTVRTLMRSANQAMELINRIVWPEMCHLIGSKEFSRARKLHRLSVASSVMMALCGVAGLLLVGPIFFKFWTAGKLQVSELTLLCFAVPVVTNAIWFTSSVVPNSANQHEGLAWRYLVGSMLTVAAGWAMAKSIGLEGVALSPVCLDLMLIPYVIGLSNRILGENPRTFAFEAWTDIWSTISRLSLAKIRRS